MPEPLQDGSRSLISSDGQFRTSKHDSNKWRRQNTHVGNAGILFVVEVCSQEVHVKRLDVAAPGSGEHRLESSIALAVAFEGKDLLSRKG